MKTAEDLGWTDCQISEIQGQRVKVASVDGVASWLHGAVGTVVGKRWSTIDQKMVQLLVFDPPVQHPASGWGPFKTIGLSKDCLDLLE